MHIYNEEELLIPALFEIFLNNRKISISDLIKRLSERLKPEGEDTKILFGRNDTKFSQKVRNLISHKKIYPKYVDYDKSNHLVSINDVGEKFLKKQDYFIENINKENMVSNNISVSSNEYDDNQNDNEFDSYEIEVKDIIDMKNDFVNEKLSFSCYELYRKYQLYKQGKKIGVIILDGEFQRNNVWGRKMNSRLIESILIGIPIPLIYVFEDKDHNYIVLDGKQRLSAIFDYFDNKYKLNDLEFLGSKLNNKKYRDLKNDDEKFASKIEDTQLNFVIIKNETSEIIKLKTFERINQQGKRLTPQELRHALHQGKSSALLKKISDKETILSDSFRTQMKDRLFILRYISIRLLYIRQLYKYPWDRPNETISYIPVEYREINQFLGDAMDAINTFSDKQIDEIEEDFWFSFHKAKEVFQSSAFQLESNKSNMIIFEYSLLIISLTRNLKMSNEDLYDLFEKYKQSDNNVNITNEENVETPFIKNIKYHRDSKENFNQRIEWLKILLRNNHND